MCNLWVFFAIYRGCFWQATCFSMTTVTQTAWSHFEHYGWEHSSSKLHCSLELADSFRQIPENIRIDTLCCILLCLSSPPRISNELMESNTENIEARKRRRRSSEARSDCTIRYVLRGKTMCLSMFSAITQVSPRVIQLHAADFSSSNTFGRYENKHSSARKGKIGANRMIVIAFLKRYSEVNDLFVLQILALLLTSKLFYYHLILQKLKCTRFTRKLGLVQLLRCRLEWRTEIYRLLMVSVLQNMAISK